MNTVINEANWNEVGLDELKKLPDPQPMGSKHNPVRHDVALQYFLEHMQNSLFGMDNCVSDGLLSPDGQKFIWVSTVNVPTVQSEDYSPVIGFLNYNNKQKAFTGILGEHVFVCSNNFYSGTDYEFKRRHIGNSMLDILNQKISSLLDNAHVYFRNRHEQIRHYKQIPVNEKAIGNVSLDLSNDESIPHRFIVQFLRQYQNPDFDYGTDGNTYWDLWQAGTHTAKYLKNPATRMKVLNKLKGSMEQSCPELQISEN